MNSQNQRDKLYFETQQKLSNQCGIHALNNMIGQQVFSSDNLNSICKQLSNDLINPHKHVFGGDYDVNILMIALQNKGFQCNWIDSRKKQQINGQYLASRPAFGYLINKQSLGKNILTKMLRFSGRHWISVRKVNNHYFLLDSKRQRPQQINNLEKFLAIEMEMGSHIIEIFKSS